MVKTTVQISKDTKWRIVIPEIVRTVEELQPGDFIEIDVKKIEKSKASARSIFIRKHSITLNTIDYH